MPGVIGMKTSKRLDLPKWSNAFLSHIDGRSQLGHVLRKRREALEHDVSAGRPENLTYGQRSLIQRVLWLEVRLEHDESLLITGEPIAAGSHSTLLNCLVACFRTLGIEPKARPVKTLQQYAAELTAEQEEGSS